MLGLGLYSVCGWVRLNYLSFFSLFYTSCVCVLFRVLSFIWCFACARAVRPSWPFHLLSPYR